MIPPRNRQITTGTKSYITVSVAALGLVSLFFLLPHWICTMSTENQLLLREQIATKEPVRMVKLYPEAAIRMIKMAAADTVILHFWNSSESDGTRLFLPLKHFSQAHPRTKVIHVCTDLNGIRQRRYSARLAQWYTKENLQYIIASHASLLDLYNHDGLQNFLGALINNRESTSAPLALVFDRSAHMLFQTSTINS